MTPFDRWSVRVCSFTRRNKNAKTSRGSALCKEKRVIFTQEVNQLMPEEECKTVKLPGSISKLSKLAKMTTSFAS